MSLVPGILLEIAQLAFYVTIAWYIVQYLRLREVMQGKQNTTFALWH